MLKKNALLKICILLCVYCQVNSSDFLAGNPKRLKSGYLMIQTSSSASSKNSCSPIDPTPLLPPVSTEKYIVTPISIEEAIASEIVMNDTPVDTINSNTIHGTPYYRLIKLPSSITTESSSNKRTPNTDFLYLSTEDSKIASPLPMLDFSYLETTYGRSKEETIPGVK